MDIQYTEPWWKDTPSRVLTMGTFDLLHFGHIAFLRQCAKLGDKLIVGINSDEFTARFKRVPVMTQSERIHAVRQLGYAAVLNASAGRELIGKIKPSVLAVGSDWARKDYMSQVDCDQDYLDDMKIIMAYVPYVQEHPISTSEIIRRVRNSE